jgi:hypothetical protein
MDDENPDTDELEELVADAELWESGELGDDPDTARRSRSAEELAELDASLGLTKVRVDLDEGLHEAMKERADKDGVGLPSVYRAALARYLSKHDGREASSTSSGRTWGDVEPSGKTVECEFRLCSDDFVKLVDLAQRQDVLPRGVLQAAFEAYVAQA